MVTARVSLSTSWPIVALLAWGVLMFGAVYPWAYWPLFAGATVIGLHGTLRGQAWRDPRLRRLLIVVGWLIVAVSVQVVALPSWLVATVSPGAERFLRAFRVGYHPAELRTLSLDPAATVVVLVEAGSLGVLLVGLARQLRRLALDWIVGQLMMLALAVALVGIVHHALSDPDSVLVYGFWEPLEGGSVFGPFVNRNHFAGWMLMLLPVVCAYGWALVQRAARHRRPARVGDWLRWVSGVDGNRVLLVWTSALVMAVGLVLTQSRSGLVAATMAMAALVYFLWRDLAGRTRLIVTTLVAVVLAGALVWSGAGTMVARFSRAGEEAHGRLSAWQDTLRIVGDFPIAGTGLGGYRHAMLLYQTRDRERIYTQAHNDYLQLAAEGGLLVCLPAAAVVAVVAGGIRRRLSDGDRDDTTYWIRRGAVAGLLGIAAQSIVEFSLQMPANAALAVTLAAIALHRPRSDSHAYRV